MRKETAILLLAFYLRSCFAVPLNMSSTDEFSLLAMKKHVNSDILSKNWSQETPFCAWIGVICSTRHPRVTGLNLSSIGLEGSISREIGNLSFLTFLDMSNNSINGLIPTEIGNLGRLRVLDVALNKLSYQIPESLGLLKKLEVLDLSNNRLSGDIPTSLSACTELRIFSMSYNNLTGHIPTGFGNLSQLEELFLWSNQLTGELPSTIFNISSLLTVNVEKNQISSSNFPRDICRQATKLQNLVLKFNEFGGEVLSSVMHCSSLRRLSLAGNKFTGNIPNEIWNLTGIQMVGLARNNFTGIVPASVGNLSNVVIFDIAENGFHGTIPSEIGQLSSLTFLSLHTNKLTGEVPQSIFNLSRLQIVSLVANNLSGNLPLSIDKGLSSIEEMYLTYNQFHGEIPGSISNLTRLRMLELSTNSFSGHIPTNLGNLLQLESLNLAGNQFTNDLSIQEQDFLSSLTACRNLKFLRISFNPITGVLPRSLGSSNLSVSLERFHAQYCRIISPLPDEFGNLSNLVWLGLGGNDLTGTVPATLVRLENLQKLEMFGNKFQGSISHVICSLKNLYSVNFEKNNLFGPIPWCLGDLSSLGEISLADNAFNSSIPANLWFNDRFEKMNFSNNFLDGALSRDIGNMKSLIEFDLSGNQLSGKIPGTISQLQNLIHLSLSNNQFHGSILESFADLKELQYLDLSRNNLSGPIPRSLESLSSLSYFNVSFNELSGEVPDGGPFANFTADSFTGNTDLCGSPQFKLEACRKRVHSASSKKKLLKYILPAIASVVVTAFICILVLRRRKISPSSSQPDSPGLLHERISYLEIVRATNNLDEANLIGRGSFGSVYRGDFSDKVAAIKVFDLDVQGAVKSFETECHIMCSIRHRNLVKVITSCSNLDFKALVMEYMPNGNLEKWLYSTNCSLNILQRLGIMVDVAAALEYLHEGFTSTPIVHCDLKPNNVLLDEDMVAHVADFGISKLMTHEQRMQQTKTLGTIGYMAPEYGSEGLVTSMVDVYSYGILLMEIFSRRKPTDEMFSGELSMKRWVSESFPNSVMQIVDDEVMNKGDESWLTPTIELALECTTDIPEDRPAIKDVLTRIRKIKFNLSSRD